MEIKVFAENDGLEARLSIRDFDPQEWLSRFQCKDRLLDHLLGLGLVPDMVEAAAVESVCSMLTEGAQETGPVAVSLKEVQSVVLASGLPPLDEEAEGLIFHRSYVSDRLAIDELGARLRESGFQEACKASPSDCLVGAGETILSFMSIREGRTGLDVFGKPVPFRRYTQFLPRAGRGIVKLEGKWVAKDPGFLVLQDNVLMVLGEGGTEPGLIRVSEDKLAAWLILQKDVAPCDDDAGRSLMAVKAGMAKLGLLPLREEARVREALETFLLRGAEQEVLLLQGTAPKPGRDGRLELLVNPEPDLPDPEAVGSVDFRAFTFFRTVREGEALARILPPDAGSDGMDVYGNITLAPIGESVRIKPGMNTESSPGDPTLLIASKGGRLCVESGIPYVVDTLKVSEDVSFKTGNLTFPGSVEVEGNVLDKFAIEAKGDVGIGGVVENGVVVSEGSIIIKGGVIGGGSGLIKSKLSSVTIGFIRNQRIESHSNIVVYNEVLNSQLLARKSVLMKSAAHSVIGGSLVAFESIDIFNSGNEAGKKTLLEVGKDFEIEAEIARKREYLKAVRSDLEFLEKKRDRLDLIVRWEGGRSPENRLLWQRVKGVATLLERVRQGLAAQLAELEAALFNPRESHIYVRGIAYPGTVLKHRDKVIPITEPTRNKRWIFKAR